MTGFERRSGQTTRTSQYSNSGLASLDDDSTTRAFQKSANPNSDNQIMERGLKAIEDITDTQQKEAILALFARLCEDNDTLRSRTNPKNSTAHLIDPVTKGPNRVAIEEGLKEAIAQNEVVTLGFIDLDKFKAINDILGHAAGDAALRKVADFLRHSIRETDLVARASNTTAEISRSKKPSQPNIGGRWGGDEFVVMFRIEGNDPNEIAASRLGIERRLAQMQHDLDQLTFEYEGKTHPVRGSMGFYHCEAGMRVELCLAAVDTRMYKIKKERKAAERAEIERTQSDPWWEAEMRQLRRQLGTSYSPS